MTLKLIINVVRLVILLITFECITPAFAQDIDGGHTHTNIHQQPDSSPLLSLVFEKTAQEKTEEVKVKFAMVELEDFSKLPILLSRIHSPHIAITSFEHRFDIKPSMFKLFCVFII